MIKEIHDIKNYSFNPVLESNGKLYTRIRRNKRKEIFLDRIVDSVADRIIAPVIEFISDLADKIKWLVVERKTDLYITVHRVLKRIIQNKETT